MPSSRFAYRTSSGATIDLDCPQARTQAALKVRTGSWSYELAASGVSHARRVAAAYDLDVSADAAWADASFAAMDADVAAGAPGTLVAAGWSQRALVLSHSAQSLAFGRLRATLSVALLDGWWQRGTTSEYVPQARTGAGLDLPADLPLDIGEPSPTQWVTVGGPLPALLVVRVYGPAHSPSVTVGGNSYAVACDVPSGGHLTIDPRAMRATLVTVTGDASDVTPMAIRGTGAGRGRYAFEPVPPGTHEVSWEGGFGFDLTVVERRGEPPWA